MQGARRALEVQTGWVRRTIEPAGEPRMRYTVGAAPGRAAARRPKADGRAVFGPSASGIPGSMAERQLRGGQLNAAVTSALVGIYTEHLGRGPTTASTFHHRNVVVTLMHDVLTPAERALGGDGHADAIRSVRRLFQSAMESDLRAAVERLTDRRVIAFIAGNDVQPDVAAEVFVLDEPL